MRDSCIFYRSFYDAILTMPPTDQNTLFRAVFDYSFDQKEPELDGLPKTIFNLFKPVINSNIKNWKNGSKPKKKPNRSQTEAKPKRKGSQTEAYKDKDNNKDVDKDKDYSFEQFWQLYGKKEKKVEAQKKFEKLTAQDVQEIFETLPGFLKSNKEIQYRPYPLTYLNQRRWKDEAPLVPAKKKQEEANSW